VRFKTATALKKVWLTLLVPKFVERVEMAIREHRNLRRDEGGGGGG
jgi:hypothetical protein